MTVKQRRPTERTGYQPHVLGTKKKTTETLNSTEKLFSNVSHTKSGTALKHRTS